MYAWLPNVSDIACVWQFISQFGMFDRNSIAAALLTPKFFVQVMFYSLTFLTVVCIWCSSYPYCFVWFVLCRLSFKFFPGRVKIRIWNTKIWCCLGWLRNAPIVMHVVDIHVISHWACCSHLQCVSCDSTRSASDDSSVRLSAVQVACRLRCRLLQAFQHAR